MVSSLFHSVLSSSSRAGVRWHLNYPGKREKRAERMRPVGEGAAPRSLGGSGDAKTDKQRRQEEQEPFLGLDDSAVSQTSD